jgi:hypothetical protein
MAQLDKILLGMLLFSSMVVSGMIFYGGVINSYDLNTTVEDAGFTDVYNISKKIYDDTTIIKNETIRADVEGSDQSIDSIVKGGYKAVKLVPDSISLINKIVNSIVKEIGIPTEFLLFFMSAVMITIIFAVIYLIFKFKG